MSTMVQKLLARVGELIHGYIPRYTGYDLDQAWYEGSRQDEEQVQDHIAGKDDFIERQGDIIVEMMGVFDAVPMTWAHVSPELRESLRSYI